MSSSSISVNDRGKTGVVVPFRRHEAGTQPPSLYLPYLATRRRAPSQPLIFLPHTLSEVTGPVFGHSDLAENDDDLTLQREGPPLGERIIVSGRVMDGDGHPVANSLIEVWQANAAGRHNQHKDGQAAPPCPDFPRTGEMRADRE